MPRHPPHALHSLSHTPPTQPPHHTGQPPNNSNQPPAPGPDWRCTHFTQNMTCHKEPTHPPQSERACHNKQSDPPHTHQKWAYTGLKDARVHYPDLKQQPHTTPDPSPTGTDRRSRVSCSLVPKPQPPPNTGQPGPPPLARVDPAGDPNRSPVTGDPWRVGLILQNPNSVSVSNPAPVKKGWPAAAGTPRRAPPSPLRAALNGRWCGLFPHLPKTPPTPGHERSWSGCVLLRKEVIQPHLPVRLPCYDFVPIASPTFDHSLRKRLGRGLRVLPTFVT
jgi:hypothetical protein